MGSKAVAQDEKTPTVSVVIGAYNAERWIEETIRSVLRQTWRDVELIVVDDGSTDATADVVRSFGESVRLLQKENGGSASARNAGTRAARGQYVAFLDADDLWLPTKLERQMPLFEDEPALAWCYTDAQIFESTSGRLLHQVGDLLTLHEGDVLRPLLLGNFIQLSVVARREALRAVGGFDESSLHRISEDWDLWLRMAAHYPVRCVREPLLQIRRHTYQKSATMDLQRALRSWRAIIDRAVHRNPERLEDLHDQAIARLCFRIGRKMLDREERTTARRVLRRGLRHAPADANLWTFWIATFIPRPFLHVLGRMRSLYRSAYSSVRAARSGEGEAQQAGTCGTARAVRPPCGADCKRDAQRQARG